MFPIDAKLVYQVTGRFSQGCSGLEQALGDGRERLLQRRFGIFPVDVTLVFRLGAVLER